MHRQIAFQANRGATVAKELSQGKKKVCILEWGDNDPLTGSFRYGARTLLQPGKSMLFTSQLLGIVRGITCGGSTVHFYATCFPVPFEMLKKYGIDVSGEVEEMRSELPIAPLKDEFDNLVMQKAQVIKNYRQL